MKLGVIADDFTGASDIANTLARGGMAATQFLGIPRGAALPSCEAGVVALKTRSIPAADAVAQSLAALAWLRAQGCTQVVFKYCSTFDSTPAGNIGPVGEALARALGDARGVVACPAFPTAGRTIYQGHLFVGDRLLHESPLRHHPLNPMTDSDLRRWLRQQTADEVGGVMHAMVRQGPDAIQAALAACAARGERLVIVDAIDDSDLVAIGAACRDAALVTGGSGIAIGLARNFPGGTSPAARFTGVKGPGAILAGSCSAMTLQQVAHHAASHPTLPIGTDDVMSGRVGPQDVAAFVAKAGDTMPLAYSSASPADVRDAQAKHGAQAVAHAIEQLFADAAAALVRQGVTRLVIAGGETSGAVVGGLGLEALAVGPEIDPGVPVLHKPDGVPLALALKSGNFGAPDFFEKALRLMAG